MVLMPATVAGRGAPAVVDGVLEGVSFADPETGYTIAGIAPERGAAELVTPVVRLTKIFRQATKPRT
jgi:hypothetical protein